MRKRNPLADYTGHRFGTFMVIRQSPIHEKSWDLLCDCGRSIVRRHHTLGSNRIPRCRSCAPYRGCDMLGKTIGRWLVVAVGDMYRSKVCTWVCLCTCGEMSRLSTYVLVNSMSLSCGCAPREKNTTHGQASPKRMTPEYRAWRSLRDRCNNTKTRHYHYYGGKGIKFDPKWDESYEAFYADVGPRPGPKYQLRRYKSDGDFSAQNLRWTSGRVEDGTHVEVPIRINQG